MARHYYGVLHRETRKMLLSSRYSADQVRFGDPADTSSSDWKQWQLAVWTSQEAASEAAALYPDDLTIIVPVRVWPAGLSPRR